MKKYNPTYIFKRAMTLSLLSLFLWSACEKAEDTSPPTITNLRLTLKDSTITAAGIGNTVAIIGTHLASTQKVLFNDFSVSINPSYIKDDVVLVQLPMEVPYRGQINKVKVITLYGEVVADFTVIQPAPTITSFAPASGNPGDIVTITGKDLDNAKLITVGSDTVKIVPGGTDTQLKFIVPAGNAAGLISVMTIGGESKTSTSFGVSLIIYSDKMENGWDADDNDAIRDMVSTEQVKKGKSIKMTFTAAKGLLAIGNSSSKPINVKKYTALKMAIYAKTTEPEVKVKVGIKGADGTTNSFSKILVLKPGWNDFTLDFALDLNKPDRLEEFQIQEWNNTKIPIIYIDDIGLL
jgi:hypothetical protein